MAISIDNDDGEVMAADERSQQPANNSDKFAWKDGDVTVYAPETLNKSSEERTQDRDWGHLAHGFWTYPDCDHNDVLWKRRLITHSSTTGDKKTRVGLVPAVFGFTWLAYNIVVAIAWVPFLVVKVLMPFVMLAWRLSVLVTQKLGIAGLLMRTKVGTDAWVETRQHRDSSELPWWKLTVGELRKRRANSKTQEPNQAG